MADYEKEISLLREKQKPLIQKREELGNEISKISKQIEKLRNKKEKQELEKPMTKQEEIIYFLFEDGAVSGDRYEARGKYWRDKGFWHSGYYPEIEQVGLKLMLYKGNKDNLEQTIKSVEEVLPFLKPIDGKKRFGIFEHTLSENGSFSLEIDDDSIDLVVHRYHRRSVEESFKTVHEMVEYVQENHYYSDEDE